MHRFKVKTHSKEIEVVAEFFHIKYESEMKQLIDYVTFEANDVCIEQIPVIDNQIKISVFKDNVWVSIL